MNRKPVSPDSFVNHILASFMVTITVIGCTKPANSGSDPNTLTYGLTLVPSGIDPHINDSAELGIPLRNVYDTLVYRDLATLEFVPGLAESWEVSDDGLNYIFKLRHDVTFHDGTQFDADAVRINLQRILDPAIGSVKAAGLLGPVEQVEVLDQFTILIKLSEPFAPLLEGLSQPYTGIASPSALANWDNATYQFHQVGTGPYRFVEYIVNYRLILERNENYSWGPAVVDNPGIPSVKRIMFKFYPDASVRSLALETGEAGIVEDIPPVDARLAAGSGAYQVQPQPIPGQPLQFILNTVRAPTDGLSFRQALILSANRPEIVRSVFQGYSSVAYGPLSSSTLYFDAGLEGRYAYDVAQAVALLNSSGWVDSNGDGWRDDPTGMPMRINLVIPPWGMIPEVAQLLATQWEKNLNIQVHLTQVASLAMLSSAAEKGDYHIIALNFFGLDPIILNEFYLSGGLRNWSHYSDAELDQWLVEAQQEENEDRRRALYSLIQNRIMDQVLIVPIRDYVNLNGIQSGIHGLHFDAQGWFPYLTDIAFGQ